jgi:hypothetical protein
MPFGPPIRVMTEFQRDDAVCQMFQVETPFTHEERESKNVIPRSILEQSDVLYEVADGVVVLKHRHAPTTVPLDAEYLLMDAQVSPATQ